MAVIQRPAKQGNATTYQGKVAQGYTGILAAEVDADLDTIYAAWNGGVDTVNIAAGSITADKIAPNQIGTRELADLGIATGDIGNLQVTTPKLSDGAVTAPKLNAAAGGDLSGTLPNPTVVSVSGGTLSVTPRGFLQAGAQTFDLYGNHPASTNYDASKSAWISRLNYTDDYFELWRAPAGSTTYATIFSVNNAGKISGGAAVGARQIKTATAFSTSTYNTPVLVYTLPALTTRGGAVLLTMNHTLYYSSSATSGNVRVWVIIYRNGTALCSHGQNYGSGGAQIVVPVPALSFVDTPPAGTYTYDVRVQIDSGTSASVVATAGGGDCIAQEIG